MDYFRGYRTFRSDPEWTSKMFVGVALALCGAVIPILPGVALQGWAALVLRRSAHGIDTPLPRLDFDFDYLGKLLDPGFKGFIVRLLWTFPASMLLSMFVMCGYFGFMLSVAGGVQAGGDAGAVAALCCFGAGMLMMFPLYIVLLMPSSVAAMRCELTNNLNEGMKFGEIIAMTRMMFRELFIGSLLIGATQMMLFVLSLLLCYIPFPFVLWLGVYVHACFQADIYKAYLAKGGAPLALAPPDLPLPVPPQPPQQLPPQQAAGGW